MRTIVHISDVHFDRIEPPVVAAIPDEVRKQEPHLVVCSGDFTQRARAKQYQHAADFMKRLPQPQLVVPGNHDIPLFDLFSRFFRPLVNYRKYISAELRPVYQDEELMVMGINTARRFTPVLDGFWKDGRISEEQLLDIELRAQNLPASVFKIVVTHHPFIPPPKERIHGIVHGAPRALAEMEKHGIDMLLAGHLHMGYSGDVRTHHEAVKRSILSVQAGTATSTRRRNEPNAYNIIKINPDHVTIQVRKWDARAGAFENGDRTHFSKIEGIWQMEG